MLDGEAGEGVSLVGITAAVARPQLCGLEHRRIRESRILSSLEHWTSVFSVVNSLISM